MLREYCSITHVPIARYGIVFTLPYGPTVYRWFPVQSTPPSIRLAPIWP